MKYRISLKFVQYATVIVDAPSVLDAMNEAKELAMMQSERIDWHPEIDPGGLQFDDIESVEELEFEE